MTYYDDNFGTWENMDDPEMVEFYFETQRQSVKKVCAGCGKTVRLKPTYDICNLCADVLEHGGDLNY